MINRQLLLISAVCVIEIRNEGKLNLLLFLILMFLNIISGKII